jgi:hypothetical protein
VKSKSLTIGSYGINGGKGERVKRCIPYRGAGRVRAPRERVEHRGPRVCQVVVVSERMHGRGGLKDQKGQDVDPSFMVGRITFPGCVHTCFGLWVLIASLSTRVQISPVCGNGMMGGCPFSPRQCIQAHIDPLSWKSVSSSPKVEENK